MPTIGQVSVEFNADAKGFLDAIEAATLRGSAFGSFLGNELSRAIDLAVGKFESLGVGALNSAANMQLASQKVGVSVETLSQWKFAADQVNVGFDQLVQGLAKMDKTAGSLTSTSKENASAFAALGISVRDTNGELKPTDELLLSVALLRELSRVDVLIVDDWAMAPLSDVERRGFLEICDDRYQTRSTVLTSQLPVSSWHAQIGDPTIADSILDRLVHNAHRIELQGESMRKKRTGKAVAGVSE